MAALIPARAHYMISLLDVLRALGGEAHREEVFAWMIENGIARVGDLNTIQTDGGTRFRKHVDFSRKELFDAGLIGDGGPGIWYLTPSGEDTYLTHASANQIVSLNQKLRVVRKARPKEPMGRAAGSRRPTAGPTTGPKPVAWSGRVTRDVLQPAVTYILRFGKTDIWKVGHAIDAHKRLSQVNKHIPTETLNISWDITTIQEWENCVLANAMEREVFRLLHSSRTLGERVRCSEKALQEAWSDAASAVKRQLS